MANTLFLSRLWHFLRITALPAYFFKKATSIVYRFVSKGIFPKIKTSNLYHPKSAGGLSVIDISAKQKVLQQRYISALLSDHAQGSNLPKYLLYLLTATLQLSYNNFFFEIPLLFPNARKPSSLTGLHVLSPLVKAIDSFPPFESWGNIALNLFTCLELPFPTICHPTQDVPSVLENSTICSKKVSYFFKMNPVTSCLGFKSRRECSSPYLLARIQSFHEQGLLQFFSFLSVHMSPSTEPDPSHSNVFSLQAYLRQLQFLHQPVLSLHNTSPRIMHYRDNPPNTSLSVGLFPGNIQRFLRSPMQSTSRNLWF
jgi:hypothetical protein